MASRPPSVLSDHSEILLVRPGSREFRPIPLPPSPPAKQARSDRTSLPHRGLCRQVGQASQRPRGRNRRVTARNRNWAAGSSRCRPVPRSCFARARPRIMRRRARARARRQMPVAGRMPAAPPIPPFRPWLSLGNPIPAIADPEPRDARDRGGGVPRQRRPAGREPGEPAREARAARQEVVYEARPTRGRAERPGNGLTGHDHSTSRSEAPCRRR